MSRSRSSPGWPSSRRCRWRTGRACRTAPCRPAAYRRRCGRSRPGTASARWRRSASRSADRRTVRPWRCRRRPARRAPARSSRSGSCVRPGKPGAADRIDARHRRSAHRRGGSSRSPRWLPRRPAWHRRRAASVGAWPSSAASAISARRSAAAARRRGRGRRENRPPIQNTASVSSSHQRQRRRDQRTLQVARFVEGVADVGHRHGDLRPGDAA